VQFGSAADTNVRVSFKVVALVNWTTMVTVPSFTEVGPEYCQTLARTRVMVYGAGSWFFHTRVLPCGVT